MMERVNKIWKPSLRLIHVARRVTPCVVVLILLSLIWGGCSSASYIHQDLDQKDPLYKRDMILTINGQTAEGIIAVPQASVYRFNVKARGHLDMFTLTTCHRDWSKERAWNVERPSGPFGWFRKIEKDEIEFKYQPKDLEKSDSCIMELGGYEKDKGRHSWALIEFQTQRDRLRADVQCNGTSASNIGVSVCQSRQGLLQRISFKGRVLISADDKCPLKPDSGLTWEFPIQKGRCSYLFIDEKNRQEHRLTTFGYKGILIREEN